MVFQLSWCKFKEVIKEQVISDVEAMCEGEARCEQRVRSEAQKLEFIARKYLPRFANMIPGNAECLLNIGRQSEKHIFVGKISA